MGSVSLLLIRVFSRCNDTTPSSKIQLHHRNKDKENETAPIKKCQQVQHTKTRHDPQINLPHQLCLGRGRQCRDVEVLVILILFRIGAGVGLDVVRGKCGFWLVCKYSSIAGEGDEGAW